MVERSHTAGWWPALYQPIQAAKEKLAEWFAPKADASMSTESYHISLELPGVSASDIDISMHDGALIVRGEKRFDNQEEGESYFFSEREYGMFQRSFRMPPDANTAGIDAEYQNGILNIRIPKVAPKTTDTQKIPIRTS